MAGRIYHSGEQVSHDSIELSSYWIDRKGCIYYVESCDHNRTAIQLGFTGACELEHSGWVHFSTYAMGYIVWNPVSRLVRPTNSQIDAIGAIETAASNVALQAMKDADPYALSMATRVLRACKMFWDELNEGDRDY